VTATTVQVVGLKIDGDGVPRLPGSVSRDTESRHGWQQVANVMWHGFTALGT